MYFKKFLKEETMTSYIKKLSLGLLALTLINCGSKGGGGAVAAPAPEGANVASDATEIVFNGDGNQAIAWSEARRNIYYQSNQACVIALGTNADDANVRQAVSELNELVNTSVISKGQRDSISTQSTYLTVRYRDNSVRTFNLNPELASSNEDTLSRGAEIIELYSEFRSALNSEGKESCNFGK